jgi:hypothetical protein
MKKLLVMTGVAALTSAPAAWAGGSPVSGYGGAGGTIQGTVQKSGALPFTGLNLTVVVAIGILLVGIGVLMRRRSRAAS